eukprot:7610911-Lingulodinium_polyedra.AAC.1
MRVALKHVVDLKRSRTQFLDPALKALVSLVREDAHDQPTNVEQSLPTDRSPPELPLPAPATPPAPSRQNRPSAKRWSRTQRALRPQISDVSAASSVQICSYTCRCPACTPPQVIEPDSPASATSKAARDEPADVPAARGGQKRQAEDRRGATPVRKRPAALLKRPAAAPAAYT